MKITKNPVFLDNFSQFIGILLFVLKYMYIFLLLKINGFSWTAKIMASPFNGGLENTWIPCRLSQISPKGRIPSISHVLLYMKDKTRAPMAQKLMLHSENRIRLKKKNLCLKAAARICFSVRIWFCKIQTFIFFLEIIIFFHFYYEKQKKFAVLEEFKHVGAQKTCKIPFDFWKYGSWNFSVIFSFGCAWRQRPIEVKKK